MVFHSSGGPPNEDPFVNVLPSVWESSEHTREELLNGIFPKQLFPWKRWPGTPNFVVERDIWACEDGWWAYIKFSQYAILNFFWTSTIPSPVEVERKIFLGSYKCGFYLFPKFKSPLTVFIGDDGVSMLVKFTRPLTTALFWWWVAETLWSAVDTIQTIAYKEEFCDNLSKVFAGDDALTTFSVNSPGANVGLWDPITDPEGLCPINCAGINIPAGPFAANFSAHFEVAEGHSVSDCVLYFEGFDVAPANYTFSNEGANLGRSGMVRIHGNAALGAVLIPKFRANRSGPSPFGTRIRGDAFTATWTG